MEALELLGSRYIKPEQVTPGPVQTFRAQNAATWRVVFIHRVSSTQEAAEQANLLKLLTTALVRSPEAKRLVLDFGEEQGFLNVVTESEPQCESLRDWLQSEISAAQKGEGVVSAEQAAAMGEFARLFSKGVAPSETKRLTTAAPVKSISETPVKAPPKPAAAVPQEVMEVLEPVKAAPPVPIVEAEPVPLVEAEAMPLLKPEEVPLTEAVQPPVSEPAPVSDLAMAATQGVGETVRPRESARAAALPSQPSVLTPAALSLIFDPPPAARLKPGSDAPVADLPKLIPEVILEPDEILSVKKPRAAVELQPMPPIFASSMPRRSRGPSKMTIFFIILGVVAILLVLVIIYLSNKI